MNFFNEIFIRRISTIRKSTIRFLAAFLTIGLTPTFFSTSPTNTKTVYAAEIDVLQAADADAEKYRAALLNLREGASEETVKNSLAMLTDAGETAFPALVTELDNQKPAAKKFFTSELWEIDPVTQVAKSRKIMTLGDVAFNIMQESIEENFPRQFRFFQVLTKDNIASWLEAHPYFSVFELREQAAQEALTKAEQQYQLDQSAHSREAVNFLRSIVGRYGNR